MQVFNDRKNFDLEAVFRGLPVPVSRDFALVLREFASFLDMQADDMERRERDREHNLSYVEWMKNTLPRLMNGELRKRPDIDRAALAVSAQTGVQPVTILHYWRRHQLESEAAARKERNRRIHALARANVTQGEIAERVGVSQATVSRVLNRVLRPHG